MSSAVLAAPTRHTDWYGGGETDQEVSERGAPAPEAAPPVNSRAAGRFAIYARLLEMDAAGVSAPRRLARHPAYAEILSMGDDAIPFLLRKLQGKSGRPLWLSLLGNITAERPGLGNETIDDAADAWIRWGRRRGYVGHVRHTDD